MSALLAKLLKTGDEGIDLDRAALEIARLVDPDASEHACLGQLDEWARRLGSRLSPSAGGAEFVAKANRLLFDELGFRGDTESYFDPANSCLNEVILRRKGLPITLAVVYLEIARRLLRPVFGVALPAHFVVRYNDGLFCVYVDVFHRGELLSERECAERVAKLTGERAPDRMMFASATKRQIVVRMLRNLENAYLKAGAPEKASRVAAFVQRHTPAEIPFNSL